MPIGPWFADFFCHRAHLVVELDGGQHYGPEGQKKDQIRTAWMEQQGILVLRFSDHDVLTVFDSVCQQIDRTVQERTEPSPWGKVPPTGADEGQFSAPSQRGLPSDCEAGGVYHLKNDTPSVFACRRSHLPLRGRQGYPSGRGFTVSRDNPPVTYGDSPL